LREREIVGDEMERGIPSIIARKAAKEKLRTEVTEITVDARHRLNDFSIK